MHHAWMNEWVNKWAIVYMPFSLNHDRLIRTFLFILVFAHTKRLLWVPLWQLVTHFIIPLSLFIILNSSASRKRVSIMFLFSYTGFPSSNPFPFFTALPPLKFSEPASLSPVYCFLFLKVKFIEIYFKYTNIHHFRHTVWVLPKKKKKKNLWSHHHKLNLEHSFRLNVLLPHCAPLLSVPSWYS